MKTRSRSKATLPKHRRKIGAQGHSNKADVLLIIPLQEEFEKIHEVFSLKWKARLIGNDVYHFGDSSNGLRIAAINLIEMGNQPALDQTRSAIDIVQPKVVFCIGIGGSLKDDLRLGDVAVSRAISEIIDAAKVSSSKSKRSRNRRNRSRSQTEESDSQAPAIQIELMQRQYEASVKLVNAIKSLPTASPKLFKQWKSQCSSSASKSLHLPKANTRKEERKAKMIQKLSRSHPEFDVCHFASGLVLATSSLKLRTANREFKIIETEGAGVGRACLHREFPIPFVVFRGVSDPADESKTALEKGTKQHLWPDGAWRRIAVENAARFVKMVLDSPLGRNAILDPGLLDVPDIKEKVSELAKRGRIRFSGRDLLDVLPIMAGILSKTKNPDDLFVSAGDLWIARPLLTHREGRLGDWFPIKSVYLLTLKPEIAALLAKAKLLPENAIRALVPNIQAIYKRLKDLPRPPGRAKCKLFHAHWASLPPFHGYVFGDYLCYGRWGVGNEATLGMQHSEISILHRDAFPEEYHSICSLLPSPEAFQEVDEQYVKKLREAYRPIHGTAD